MSEESKFNFSEEETIKSDQAVEESKKAVKEDAKGLWESIKTFMVELLDFRHDTDRDATIEAIKGDISFKGATTWILVCSIFVASIGSCNKRCRYFKTIINKLSDYDCVEFINSLFVF